MLKRRLAKALNPFFSDLDDFEWARLRTEVFPDHPDPTALRPVVNALVYRERALCPWELLPPEFPPAAVLRPHLEQWEADGTWEQVREFVST
ncbi:MAG TPA: transposase, partial [Gemmataceae bacterium]|nr:transposase [Gemmataceae bacterium]